MLPVAAAAEATAPATGTATTTLASDAEARWIPFELTPGNQIRFTAQLNGRAVSAILDTGVSHSVVSQHHAAAQRLAVRQEGRAQVIGGAVELGWTPVSTLAFGALASRGGRLTVAALPAGATGTAAPVELLIGRDILAAFALDIDYAGTRFRLLPSGRMPFTGAAAPLAISPDRLVYVSQVTLGGARLQPIVVDTGDGAALTLSAAAWRTAHPPVAAVTDTISFGLGGTVVSDLAVVPALAVGELAARDVEVRIERAGGFSETIGVAGRMGSGFLQRYRVLLDPGAGRMVLAPAAGATAVQRSTSGLLLGFTGTRLRVLHVMRGGPGAAKGWRVGEEICRVDGEDVATLGFAGAGTWSAARPGRTVRLSLCDGTERRLTLRRFY